METQRLANFTARLRFNDLNENSKAMVKYCLMDWLGVAVRGSKEQSSLILKKVVCQSQNKGHVIFQKEFPKTGLYEAVFCNSANSHSMDFDDLYNGATIHPGCVVIPSVLAMAEREHSSGQDIIAAICAGYEACTRVGESVNPESYKYWHTTGTAGVFGSAAAAANLLHLSDNETLMCYGTAGTQAAGLWEFLNDGAMSKPLHAGKAATAGVFSAYLSKEGFTGASRILEGNKGFCKAMSSSPHYQKICEKLGLEHLKIEDTSFKPYPCCKHTHSSVYAIWKLKNEYKFSVDNIRNLELHVNSLAYNLTNDASPKNSNSCRFSIQYCSAMMAVYGQLGIDNFTSKFIEDPKVREVMSEIEVYHDDAMDKIHDANPSKMAAKVIIRLKDGQEFSELVEYPKGDPANPMSWEECKSKFQSLASAIVGKANTECLADLVENLELVKDWSTEVSKLR